MQFSMLSLRFASILTVSAFAFALAGCGDKGTGQVQASKPEATPVAHTESAAAPAGDAIVLRFKVGGMTCNGCAASVRNAVEKIEGVTACEVSHKEGSAVVTTTNPAIADQVVKAITDLKFTAEQTPG